MKKELKHELAVAVQYLVIVFIALVTPYLRLMLGSDAINLREAWKNVVDPYFRSVLLVFAVVSLVRLLVLFLAKSSKARLA